MTENGRIRLRKVRLDDEAEGISPPWQAWLHPARDRKFYTNTETKESIWEHPSEFAKRESPSKARKPPKRRNEDQVQKNEQPDVERMEVDLPPPQKRTVEETKAIEESSTMRSKKPAVLEVIENRSQVQNTCSHVAPLVSWSSKVRPFNQIPYRGCAVFDTCALIENPGVLDTSVDKQILTVIPYAVLTELDGLKNSEELRKAASSVSNRLRALQEQKHYYLRVETSVEQRIQIDDFLPNQSVKDDSILKCALRIKKEVLSIFSTLQLNERAILLVTNDSVLSNKAMTHDLAAESVDSFIDIINERVKKSCESSKKSEKRPVRQRDVSRSRSERRSKSEEKPSEKNYSKVAAVESVKKNRETMEWINNMIKSSGGEKCFKINDNTNTPSKPRPTIPLEDEIVPAVRTDKARRPSSSSQKSAYIKRPVNTIELNSNRPRMPLSLSDDESNIGDDMDCT